MADRTFLLGIDVSTTGAKALLIAATGEVVASASTPLTVSTPHPLWSEQSPADWWSGIVQSIRRVLAESDLAHLRRQLDSGWWIEVVLLLSHTDFADPQGLAEREMRSRWVCVEEKELRLVKVLRFLQ